jgi:hypothetical protein
MVKDGREDVLELHSTIIRLGGSSRIVNLDFGPGWFRILVVIIVMTSFRLQPNVCRIWGKWN